MNSHYPNEVRLGITLVILFALLSNAKLLKREYKFNPKMIGRDSITQYEKRFEGLKKILSPHSVVGYITDIGELNQEDKSWKVDAGISAKYYLTQYALVPVSVDYTNKKSGFVIGNFHSPINNSIFPEDRDFVVLKNFGNGVILFKTKVK